MAIESWPDFSDVTFTSPLLGPILSSPPALLGLLRDRLDGPNGLYAATSACVPVHSSAMASWAG